MERLTRSLTGFVLSRAPRDLVTVAVVTFASISVRPHGASGAGPVVVGLTVLSAVLLLLRLFPIPQAPWSSGVPAHVVAVAAACTLAGFDRSGAGIVYAFFLAGQLGYRLPQPGAIGFATAIGAGSTIAVLVGHAVTGLGTPWWTGALTGTPVVLGMANRSREHALAAERESAEQARRAVASEARAHTLAERARIARDVHDVLAHSLASVNLQLEAVDALLESGGGADVARARTATQRAQRLVREGLAEVSRTVSALREDALPLVDTLTAMVEGAAPEGTPLEVTGAPVELPAPTATALTRCAQEALTNARKHAPGAAVSVRVCFAGDAVELDVHNGPAEPGRAALAASGSGMGLLGMRERVAEVGGTVRTGPVDGGGWAVRVRVPSGARAA